MLENKESINCSKSTCHNDNMLSFTTHVHIYLLNQTIHQTSLELQVTGRSQLEKHHLGY
jgi:hypothetical protein